VTAWHEEPIDKKHDREAFDCGENALNEFLRRFARKSHELGGAKTFLAIDDAGNKTVLGFYSLSPASVHYARTPEIVRRGLARHDVPGFRLARLAVDRSLQGQGLGGQLLRAAGRRCLLAAAEVGGIVLVIDAKNARGAKWYGSYGAVPLLDAPLSLVLPLATIEAALSVGQARGLRRPPRPPRL
jgi:GNAT superfamily N-acetyltransferase